MWDINLYPLFQYIGCSTLEKQLAQQGFRGVTTKVLSYSKHTLLCLYGHNVLGRMYDINAYMFTHFFVWILLDQIATVLPYDSESVRQ